ncbi:MAG: 50S ribosomal protein L17 [Oscillospiraceae bacterium]|nr:50S ribosomal protein L17 [Oscillospiraceae bacterium]
MYARKIGRKTDHRLALLKNLVMFLIENERITTTLQKAKELSVLADKYISRARVNTLHNKRYVLSFIKNENTVKKLFDKIAPRFAERKGGFTRIIKLGPRRGDAAEMAIIEFSA